MWHMTSTWDAVLCSSNALKSTLSPPSEPGMGRPPLRAQDFMANNPEHLELLRRMGVSLIHLKDGRVQLVQHATQVIHLHRSSNTATAASARKWPPLLV